MVKKKVCKKCKLFVEGETCPSCKGNSFTNNWQGRVYITNPVHSMIAKKVGMEAKGEYAIKVR
ncbi:MAG TPA: transcription elongation factor subunit Spt4 [Candidatus Nanoarchaeia archaeon]|nr:transcription elongation factor subunit Spt4 [Candidatus Nanoarchaeia archaeon]